MAFSIALVESASDARRMFSLVLGEWESVEEINSTFGGSGERAILVKRYDQENKEPNAEIMEAIARSAGNEFALGRDLEHLLTSAFEMGRMFPWDPGGL